jgi:hypothetical protein
VVEAATPQVCPESSAGRRIVSWPAAAVGSLILVSVTGRIWLGRSVPTPWISPDEVIYALLGRTLYSSGRLAIENAHSDFYSFVYPALIGPPLAWLGPSSGYAVAKALGAAAMSAAAIPAYIWARALVPARAAVLVAALTLALPAFAYSGFLMTETAFYPVMALAAWQMARTIVEPTAHRQLALVLLIAAAAATRVQGGVLVLVLPTALLLARVALRRYAWALGGVALLVVVWLAWRLLRGGSTLGAYTTAASGGYDAGAALRFVVYHAGALVVMAGFFPLAAAALLWARRRGLTADARATLAVATALSLWLVVQVGVFASRYVGQLAERDLIAAAPPLFVCLALWLREGAPRPRRWTLGVALAALASVFAWPLHTLVTADALPDSPTIAAVYRAVGTSGLGRQQLLLDGSLALAAAALVVAPARLLRAAPLLLVALLGLESVVAANVAARAAGRLRDTLVGPRPTWIDDSADGPVSLLYAGATQWNVVWETLFWNREVDRVFALPGTAVLGPAPGGAATLDGDGALREDGVRIDSRSVVAPYAIQLSGTRTADAGNKLVGVPIGLALWQTEAPVRVLSRSSGLQPNGDIYRSATLTGFGCPGTFRLTLIAKEDETIGLLVNGRFRRSVQARQGQIVRLGLPAASGAGGRCTLGVRTDGKLLGSTVFAFEPGR